MHLTEKKIYFTLCLVLILKPSLTIQIDNNENNRFFLSEIISVLQKNSVITKPDLKTELKLNKYNMDLNTKTHKTSLRSKVYPLCELKVVNIPLRINKFCEEIVYSYQKCDGYCSSRTFFYGNEEINKFSCCSIDKFSTENSKIY